MTTASIISSNRPSLGARVGRRRFAIATAALCLMTAMLRLWHVDHGLPEFSEEAFPFRHALTLWGTAGEHIDLNPHWFAYPSLTLYLQFLVQRLCYLAGGFSKPADYLLRLATDPSGAVIAARSLGVVADIVTVVLVGRIARRFGDLPALLAMAIVALSPTMIQTSRLLYSDSVMCACSTAAIDRLLAYREYGDWKRLAVAAGLVGLAMGAKYPAMLLFVSLGTAIWQREQRRHVFKMWVSGVGVAGGVFLCTTPYLLTSWPEFVRDAVYIGDSTSRGTLGVVHGFGLPHYLLLLSRNLGWVGAGLLVASLFAAIRGPSRQPTGLLWISWLMLFVPIAAVPVEADRYLVPTIAVSACLIAAGSVLILDWLRDLGRAAAVGVVVVGTLQPAWAGVASAMAGRNTTQLEARRWCEAHLEPGDLLLSEAYGPNLLTYGQRAHVMADPLFGAASRSAQLAYESQRAFHLVWLPLLVGGYASVRLPTRESQELAVYPHAVDWNAAGYDVRLLQGVDYVATTDAVRGRFAADTVRFREQYRFYSFLDSLCERVAVITSSREVEGPSIAIYKLTARARAAVSSAGRLDTLWWGRTVPERFKTVADSLLEPAMGSSELIPGLPLWVQPLRIAYAQRYGPFADDLAGQLATLGHLRSAEDLAIAGLTVAPADVVAAQIYAQVAAQLGEWADMERRLARSNAIIAEAGPVPVGLQFARAEALCRVGDQAGAKLVFLDLMQSGNWGSSVADRERLSRLHAEISGMKSNPSVRAQ